MIILHKMCFNFPNTQNQLDPSKWEISADMTALLSSDYRKYWKLSWQICWGETVISFNILTRTTPKIANRTLDLRHSVLTCRGSAFTFPWGILDCCQQWLNTTLLCDHFCVKTKFPIFNINYLIKISGLESNKQFKVCIWWYQHKHLLIELKQFKIETFSWYVHCQYRGRI